MIALNATLLQNLPVHIVLFALVFYLLPSIVAVARRHFNATAIMVLNVLLGWTVLGWVAALVWAVSNSRRAVVVAGPGADQAIAGELFRVDVEGISGTTPDGSFRQALVRQLKPREALLLQAGTAGVVDVMTEAGQPLGYLSSTLAADLLPAMEAGRKFYGVVVAVTGKDGDEKGASLAVVERPSPANHSSA